MKYLVTDLNRIIYLYSIQGNLRVLGKFRIVREYSSLTEKEQTYKTRGQWLTSLSEEKILAII